MPDADYIADLQKAIADAYRCQSKHVQSIPVDDSAGEHVVVEVFELLGCSEALWCYAWKSAKEGGPTFLVLQIPPVISPRSAVASVLRTGTQSDDVAGSD